MEKQCTSTVMPPKIIKGLRGDNRHETTWSGSSSSVVAFLLSEPLPLFEIEVLLLSEPRHSLSVRHMIGIHCGAVDVRPGLL